MIKINLIADRQAKDRLVIQQQLALGMIVVVATVALCGFFWVHKSSTIARTEDKITTAKNELEQLKKKHAQVTNMEKKEKLLNTIIDTINGLKKQERGPTIYFDHLNVILPSEIWMTDLNDINGVISIKGYSFSNNAIADLMKEMRKSKYFVDVDLSEIKKAKFGGEILKQFSLRCMTAAGKKMAEEAARKKAAKAKKKKGRRR